MNDAVAKVPSVVDFRSPLPEVEAYRPPLERILSGDPVQRAYNLFSSADGRFHSGVWTCEPGKWRVVFTESEFCQLLEGTLIVTSDDGTVSTYGAGDAFVTPSGFTGTWDVVVKAKKVYAYYE